MSTTASNAASTSAWRERAAARPHAAVRSAAMTAPRRRILSRLRLSCLLVCRLLAPCLIMPILLTGCASGGVKNPFRGPSEARFTALVERNCGNELVGGQAMSSLLASDTSFRQLTSRLYQGGVSNDEYVNLLMQQYPAADANIPATGCVVDQLARCLAGNCDASPAESPDAIDAQEMIAERDAGIDEVRPADRDAVETMIEDVDSTPAEPVEPLPSQDPAVLASGTPSETATEIEEPDKP